MALEVGKKVKVNLTPEQMSKLGIQNAISNPCEITGKYTNGVDGYYMKTASNATIAVPNKPGYITEI